jgi:hypothetical protein
MISRYSTLAILLLSLLSCANKSENSATADYIQGEQNVAQATQASLAKAPVPDVYSNGKKIIKKAHYRFEVKDSQATTKAIESAVQKFGAYIETSNLVLENPVLENTITIRVLNESFAALLKEIDAQAVFVNFRNITTDDVSKDYVDLESRIRTKREVEQRYMDILRNKAGTIEELLQAEEKIGALHEEIEATISRLNYLKDQVTYSTIQLEFYQTVSQQIVSTAGDSFLAKAEDALVAGWNGVTSILIILLYLWPIALIIPLIYYFMKKRKRTTRIKST